MKNNKVKIRCPTIQFQLCSAVRNDIRFELLKMFWDLKQRIFLTIDWTAYDKDNRTRGMCRYCCIMHGNFKTCDKIYSWNRDCLVLTYGELRTKVTDISCFCIHHSLTLLILRHLGSIVSDVLSWMSASPHCLFTGVVAGAHCLLKDAAIFLPICKLWMLVFDLPIDPDWLLEPWNSNSPSARLNSGW